MPTKQLRIPTALVQYVSKKYNFSDKNEVKQFLKQLLASRTVATLRKLYKLWEFDYEGYSWKDMQKVQKDITKRFEKLTNVSGSKVVKKSPKGPKKTARKTVHKHAPEVKPKKVAKLDGVVTQVGDKVEYDYKNLWRDAVVIETKPHIKIIIIDPGSKYSQLDVSRGTFVIVFRASGPQQYAKVDNLKYNRRATRKEMKKARDLLEKRHDTKTSKEYADLGDFVEMVQRGLWLKGVFVSDNPWKFVMTEYQHKSKFRVGSIWTWRSRPKYGTALKFIKKASSTDMQKAQKLLTLKEERSKELTQRASNKIDKFGVRPGDTVAIETSGWSTVNRKVKAVDKSKGTIMIYTGKQGYGIRRVKKTKTIDARYIVSVVEKGPGYDTGEPTIWTGRT